ncbi:MAG: hypothetical protein A2014_02855 [Spirochaetes bacterium GWF1_49_6]|nr:MAG: hypothetical protein A2014_02855 [Spirochaetes bacterium GWF1_49_6]
MSSITVRNIPDDIFETVKTLAKTERRSVNNEIVILIETGLRSHLDGDKPVITPPISRETQLSLWKEMSGKWEDDRTTGEIISDIYGHRTMGREVSL